MSYYQDDNSYHYYSEPAYVEDTSNYSYSIPNHDDYSPSEPIYYDHNNTSDTVHYADTPSYDELEAYAEAASNRMYTEDEIHPAYRDNPSDDDYTDLSDTVEPPEDDLHPANPELHYEDGVHPAYRNYPVNNNYEELPTPENHWEEYTWVSRRSAEGVIMYDPPIDPTFYTPS